MLNTMFLMVFIVFACVCVLTLIQSMFDDTLHR